MMDSLGGTLDHISLSVFQLGECYVCISPWWDGVFMSFERLAMSGPINHLKDVFSPPLACFANSLFQGWKVSGLSAGLFVILSDGAVL